MKLVYWVRIDDAETFVFRSMVPMEMRAAGDRLAIYTYPWPTQLEIEQFARSVAETGYTFMGEAKDFDWPPGDSLLSR